MALDAEIGGETSNSYVTLEDANLYFDDRLNTAEWDAADNATREKALITFCRRVDEETFTGSKADSSQALKFPRVGCFDEDGNEFASDDIPQRVKDAQCVGALELLKADFLAENYMGNFSYFSAGTVQIKQFTPQGAGRLPADVLRLLRILITSAGGGRLVRA
jgi:hypothetical protein